MQPDDFTLSNYEKLVLFDILGTFSLRCEGLTASPVSHRSASLRCSALEQRYNVHFVPLPFTPSHFHPSIFTEPNSRVVELLEKVEH